MLPIKLNLPDDFLKEEVRFGYTVSVETKELWAIELDLLKQLQDVCQKHNIKYYAEGGTLLGAVRHKGFIPWDNDIDITMFRDEYEKFCSYSHEFQPPYELQFYNNTEGYFTGHAQLRNTATTGVLKSRLDKISAFKYNQGVFIDIFILDAVSDDPRKRKKQLKHIKYYKKLAHVSYNSKYCYEVYKDNFKYVIAHYVQKIFRNIELYKIFYKKYEDECKKYTQKKTEIVGIISFMPNNPKILLKREFFDNTIQISFEMFKLPAPFKYDNILGSLYGNYMEYVITKGAHGDIIFNSQLPYSEWLKKFKEN